MANLFYNMSNKTVGLVGMWDCVAAADMGTVPPELMGKFHLIFYQTPEDAVFKALGVE
ncbi:MAG: hypothetical protein ACYDEJ_04345 [Desulfitobacteriaceae bacterium]